MPADFFNQVDFSQEIDAKCGRRNLPSIGRRQYAQPKRVMLCNGFTSPHLAALDSSPRIRLRRGGVEAHGLRSKREMG